MAKWYDQWLTEQERNNLQVGQKGIRARRRKQEDEANRGYPRSSTPVSQPSKKNAEAGIKSRQSGVGSAFKAFNNAVGGGSDERKTQKVVDIDRGKAEPKSKGYLQRMTNTSGMNAYATKMAKDADRQWNKKQKQAYENAFKKKR